jgi:hypothetical protein
LPDPPRALQHDPDRSVGGAHERLLNLCPLILSSEHGLAQPTVPGPARTNAGAAVKTARLLDGGSPPGALNASAAQRMIPVCPREYRPGCGYTQSPCGPVPTGIRWTSFPVMVLITYTVAS